MRKMHALVLGLVLAAPLSLGACGAPALLSSQTAQGALEAQGVPPASAFVTIEATVTRMLPEDNHGLPHQNFVVEELSPKAGVTLQVNNDTKYGTKVPGLAVGQKLIIRGTTYPGGIHWTHKANKPGDAGYIKTADGKIYQ